MSSKVQAKHDNKVASKQLSSKPPVPVTAAITEHTHPATIIQRARFEPGSLTPRDVLQLQRTIGNQAAQRLLRQAKPADIEVRSSTEEITHSAHDFSQMPVHAKSPASVQAKLEVSSPGDAYEQEADHVAEQVMRMPEPKLQRTCACGGSCPDCQTEQPAREHARFQTKHVGSSNAGQSAAPPIVREALASPGQPLDASTRAFFEPRFGHDFSRVRVHSDANAEQSARDVNANAYTVGNSIVFDASRFAPGTHEGRRLIAHELTHVMQQRRVAPFIQRDSRGKQSDAPPKHEELTQYKSTDPVIELKPVFKQAREAWELTVEGDYTTPESIRRMLWPKRDQIPPGVSIKPIFVIESEGSRTDQGSNAPKVYGQQAIFEITGDLLYTLKTMDPLFAEMFANLGLIEESKSLQAARAAFRARHDSFNGQVLDNIDAALKLVTRNNPGLLEAFYRRYSDWPLKAVEVESSSDFAGETDIKWRGGRGRYTDINAGILHLQHLPAVPTDHALFLLGETLIHEYAHTSHATDYHKGPGEGKAYGIENFFAERLGDKQRDEVTLVLGPKKGDKMAFDTSYFVMKQLYEVIDKRPSKFPSLKGVSQQRAREMSVEFVSKNKEDFSAELKRLISEFAPSAFESLPSREKN